MNQNQNDFIQHFGVMGMKWGRRKSRPSKGSNTKKSSKNSKSKTSSVKKAVKHNKILTDSRKETLKKIAKTTAKVGGAVAATAILGSVGAMAFQELAPKLEELSAAYSKAKGDYYKEKSITDLKSGNLGNAFDSGGKALDSYKDLFEKSKKMGTTTSSISRR